MVSSKVSAKQHSINQYDTVIKKNFWRYTKLNLEAEEKLSPTLNLTRCTDYFKNVWKCVCPRLTFNIPDWIQNLLAPKYEFQLTQLTLK